MLNLPMKFVSLLFFFLGVRNCLGGGCFGISRFLGKGHGPTSEASVPNLARAADHDPEVNKEAEIALARKLGYNMRPLVMPNWEDNKDIITTMVNEAEYDFEQAKSLPQIQRNSHELQAFMWLEFYSRKVLTLAQQKAFRLRSTLGSALEELDGNSAKLKLVENSRGELGTSRSLHMPPVQWQDLSTLEASKPTDSKEENKRTLSFARTRTRRPQGPILESQSSKHLLSEEDSDQTPEIAELGLDLERAGFEISEGLKDCLLIIFPLHEPPKEASVREYEDFIKALFRAVEFLHKYNFINPNEMKKFFTSDTHMLSLTGEHIGHSFSFYSTAILQLDMNDMVFSPETDHIRHCLKDLDHKSQKMITHIAFSSILKRSKPFNNWGTVPSKLKEITDYFTQEVFGAHILWQMQNREPKQSIIECHAASLIKNFQHPQGFLKEYRKMGFSSTYMLTVTLLYHFGQNLSDEKDLISICEQNNIGYKQLKAKFQIFVIMNRILSKKARWEFYADFEKLNLMKVFPYIQTNFEKNEIGESIAQLTVEYYQCLQELESTEDGRDWKNCPVVQNMIDGYSELLEEMKKSIIQGVNNS